MYLDIYLCFDGIFRKRKLIIFRFIFWKLKFINYNNWNNFNIYKDKSEIFKKKFKYFNKKGGKKKA